MRSTKYILVTGFPRHWDKVGNKSSFTFQMLHGKVMNPDNIVEHTSSIFIKIDSLGLVSKCWEGEILTKKKTEEKVWFEFALSREIPCPPQYVAYRPGWYVDEAS